jgi:CRISPR/Cas system-associated endonuclease/helicase Cas3
MYFLSENFAYPQDNTFPWLKNDSAKNSINKIIPVPEGYEKIKTEQGTFDEWLRNLPLKQGNPPVLLYNGKKKSNQKAHHAVIDMDVGKKDLQQCADAVIRLRAEYLFYKKDFDAIHFNFTSGEKFEWKKWMEGYRPAVKGSSVAWKKTSNNDSSYKSFRNYLETVFLYAGTFSLSKELKKVVDINDIKAGDVFIHAGFPGHAVIVADVAASKKTGKKIFMLAQSFMPAQEIHILKNPNNALINPWYETDSSKILHTPEWTFKYDDLMRF